jgi:hypothetical protein
VKIRIPVAELAGIFEVMKLTVIVPVLVPFVGDGLTQSTSGVIDHRSGPPPDLLIVTICEATLLPDDAETLKVVGFTTSVCPNTDSGTNNAATAIRTRAHMAERECIYGLLPKMRLRTNLELRPFGPTTAPKT